MSFPFPKNPTDGQVVSSTAPDGSILTATYKAAKNEWELTRTPPPATAISSGAPPSPVVVTATADGQVITWDQAAGRWVAKAPSAAVSGTTKSFVKGTQAAPDQANGVGPAQLRPGDIQFTAENLHHEIKFWNGANWLESLSEDTIKQWISAGSLFRGVVKESTLGTLPVVALANRGFYYSWTGAPGYVVKAADPAIGTDLAGEVLQVGDWIQSSGTAWVHVPGDLLSKQRWDSLGSFIPWSDTSWERGALVSYQQGFWRANALISPGDDPPEVAPGNKWTDITPHPSIKLAELADVNDNVALQGEDGVLIWSEIDGEFVVSRTLQVDAIEFDATGPGIGIEGLFQGDISLGKNLDSQVPSVEAVARYVDSRSLEDLAGSTDLNTAQNGEFIAYDAANNKWIPKAASSSIAGLTDVDLTTPPTDTQVLSWNNTAGRWMPRNGVYAIGDLTDVDTRTVAPNGGDVLTWDTATWKNKPQNFLGSLAVAPTTAATGAIYYQNVLIPAAAGAVGTPGTPAVKVGLYRWDGTAWQKLVVGGIESHNNTSALAGASDKQVPVYNATNGEWEPKTLSTPIIYLGQGAWVAADVGNATRRYGMPVGTIPDPGTWPPAAGDQYIDLATGMVTAFTGPGGVTRVITGGSNVIDFVPTKLEDLTNVADTPLATANQLLVYDGTQWLPLTPPFDTVSSVDAKINTVVTGLEHGVAVIDMIAAPPATPVVDEVYIVGPSATGAWAGQSGNLARWDGTAWQFTAPQAREAHLIESQSAIFSWNGTAWVKVATGTSAPAAAAELHAVGDIKQSWLTEAQFVNALGAAEAAKWVLADGRDVSGSRFTTITGQSRVPDLRGSFLRAAGQNGNAAPNWNGNAPGSVHSDTTRAPRNTAFTGGTSTDGDHNHKFATVSTQTKGGGDYEILNGWDRPKYTENAGNHTHNVTITGGGDVETAPVHYSVNHYIKIN